MNETQQHQPETAGAVMAAEIPTVEAGGSMQDAMSAFRARAGEFDTLNYIYVVDDTGLLKGAISLKALFTAEPNELITDAMEADLVTAVSTEDQEAVSRRALHHQLKAIPVVDEAGKLLGVVPPHVILQILQQEHEEDVLTEAGVPPAAIRKHQQTVRRQVSHRLPWLILGAVGGVAAASIVQLFEGVLAEEILLAAFIPTVVYLADAVGVQVQTVYIQFAASHAVTNLWRYLLREIMISLVVAGVLGVFTFGLVWGWFGALYLAIIVASAAAISIIFASVVAVLLPGMFQKFHIDPAVASGPFGTIIRDVASIAIYFLIAQMLIQILV